MKTIDLDIEQLNQRHWDELAPVHLKSYDLQKLFSKESLLNDIERNELGDIKDKRILHLQCHIGKESISLALEGADVTAVDFSSKSIEIAKDLVSIIGVNVHFIHSNIYDLTKVLNTKFDIIYTSKGVLQWLNDLNKWANIIYCLLSDNGFFYIQEIHPIKYLFDPSIENHFEINCQDEELPIKQINFDYSNKNYLPINPAYEYRWSLGEIISAIAEAGLKIEFVNEINKLFYNGHPGMIKDMNGWWYLPKYKNKVPLTFSLKAIK
jgi:ubiquinone/menaquinone biosynthesis C-methylase UbiE